MWHVAQHITQRLPQLRLHECVRNQGATAETYCTREDHTASERHWVAWLTLALLGAATWQPCTVRVRRKNGVTW